MKKLHRAASFLLRMGFPWPGARRDSWSRAGRKALLRRWPAALRPFIWILSATVWPVSSLILSLRVAKRAKTGPRGLWWQCWHAALTRNIPPREFVLYQLHLIGALDKNWTYESETSTLLGQISHSETAALIRDKRAFHDWLSERGMPVVEIIEHLNVPAIIVKPREGRRGDGLVTWTQVDKGLWRSRTACEGGAIQTISSDALLSQLRSSDVIQQRVVEAGLGLDQPAVTRIITTRTEAEAHVLEALVQIPAEGDLTSHRGPFRRVRVETGEVREAGPGQRSLMIGGLRPVMPLEGQILPGWHEILAHLIRAHKALPPPCPLIGWDVIWGSEGPLILEANIGIAFTLVQTDTLEPVCLPEGVL
ncbi:MAG: sugar-transfer associated ATP-grasp domain-containing protein [Pseudomonadota bacterium]